MHFPMWASAERTMCCNLFVQIPPPRALSQSTATSVKGLAAA